MHGTFPKHTKMQRSLGYGLDKEMHGPGPPPACGVTRTGGVWKELLGLLVGGAGGHTTAPRPVKGILGHGAVFQAQCLPSLE